jgi:DNA-binding MarR family transcriptional regulator
MFQWYFVSDEIKIPRIMKHAGTEQILDPVPAGPEPEPPAETGTDAADAPAATLRLREFLPYRLSVLSNLVSGLIAREYSTRFDLSMTQWRLMAVLAEHEELAARDIEPIVRMDKVAISRAVRSLTQRRLVRRRASQQDGRLAFLSLTAAGRRVYDEVRPIALRHEAELLAVLSEEEATTLTTLLARLDAHALTLNAPVTEDAAPAGSDGRSDPTPSGTS